MFCPHCGKPLPENGSFCPNCGAQFRQNSYSPAPTPAPAHAPGPKSGDLVQSTLRKMVCSSKFLAAVIALTASVVLSVLAGFMPVPSFDSILAAEPELQQAMALLEEELMQQLGITMSDVMSELSSRTTVSVSLLPILYSVFLWIMYATAKDPNRDQMNTTGLSVIKVFQTIGLVFTCIGAAFSLLIFVIMLALPGEFMEPDLDIVVKSMSIFALIVFGIIFGVSITYQALMVRSITAMRDTAKTGVLIDKVSGFAAVLTIVGGCLSALSVVSSLGFTVSIGYVGGMFGTLSSGCSAAASILFGLLMLDYRKKVKELIAYGQRPWPAGGSTPPVEF